MPAFMVDELADVAALLYVPVLVTNCTASLPCAQCDPEPPTLVQLPLLAKLIFGGLQAPLFCANEISRSVAFVVVIWFGLIDVPVSCEHVEASTPVTPEISNNFVVGVMLFGFVVTVSAPPAATVAFHIP